MQLFQDIGSTTQCKLFSTCVQEELKGALCIMFITGYFSEEEIGVKKVTFIVGKQGFVLW